MATATYPLKLTGYQLRVVHETLSVVLNDPDWFADNRRDATAAAQAHDKIIAALRVARRAESTPA